MGGRASGVPLYVYIQTVAYAEKFHGEFHSVAYGGHLYLVCAVCDVIFMFPNQRFGEVY